MKKFRINITNEVVKIISLWAILLNSSTANIAYVPMSMHFENKMISRKALNIVCATYMKQNNIC